MRRLATVTSLLIAMVGAAAAQPYNRPVPVNPGEHPPYDRGVDEGARRGDYGTRPYENRWVPFVNDLALTQPRLFIPLSLQMGRYHRLRIERRAGLPYIHSVEIEFGNGEHQFFRLERQLQPGNDALYINLNGERGLRRIMVNVEPDPRASCAVIGI